jgi:hypothetical protein
MLTQLIIVIAFLWAGMILGISFLESWVKFRTQTLTRPVGLDVGRTVFRAFHKTQYILILMLIIIGFFAHLLLWCWLIFASIVSILVLQRFWLFPYLSRCVDNVLAGNKLSKSHIHFAYGILEIIKLGLLFCLSFILMTMKFGL